MRLSVSTKIVLSLIGVLAIFASVSIYSMVALGRIGEALQIVDTAYIPLTKIAAELGALGARSQIDLKELASMKDPRSLRVLGQVYPAAISGRVAKLVESAEQLTRGAERRGASAVDKAFFERARSRMRDVKRQQQANVADLTVFLRSMGRTEPPDLNLVRDRLRKGDALIRSAVLALTSELDSRITGTVLSVRREQRTGAWAVMALTVLAAAVGLFLALYAHYTLRPIQRLTAGVARIAHGDFTQRVSIASKDEIGVLASEFNVMAEALLERERRLSEQQRELERAAHVIEEEKRFSENIVQSIRSAIVVTDRDGLVTALNAAAGELLALEVGQDLTKADALRGATELAARLRAALAGEESLLEGVPGPAGRGVDLKLAPFRDAGSGVQGVILIADDVTERIRTKEALVKSERLAAVGRIAAQITHEIRNPLSSIGLNAELLGEEVQGGEGQALLRSIVREVDRLTEVTEGYLRYARLPTPRLDAEDVNELLGDLLRFMDGDLRARKIELTRDFASLLPKVLADENQLRQAFLNLLRNGCEAMRDGGHLTVTTRAVHEAVEVAIRDTGAGIAPEHLLRIFDPFFSTKEAGTGLGLALTHQILEEHGGRVTCESTVGIGTTFRVTLRPASSSELAGADSGAESVDV